MAASVQENATNQAKSSSDISDNERMEYETVPQKIPCQASDVHDFVKKLSAQEYQWKQCSKVKMYLILSDNFVTES